MLTDMTTEKLFASIWQKVRNDGWNSLRNIFQKNFFGDNAVNISLRNLFAREMLANTLMHREFTSSYMAKFGIEKDRMYVENASRASRAGIITPENLEPNPKNPIIASFFRTIGRADRLGSGVRNLFKYTKYYSGQEPEFMEGDVFRHLVPLDDGYSFDFEQDKPQNIRNGLPQSGSTSLKHADMPAEWKKSTGKVWEKLNPTQKKVLDYVEEHGKITNKEVQKLLGVKELRA